MSGEALFALGKLGGPVRLVMTCQKADAFAARQDDEVVCLLHSMPARASMILQDGSDVVEIAPSMDEVRAYALNYLRGERDRALAGGCDTPAGRVDTDEVSRSNISGSVSMAMLAQAAGAPFSIVWRMRDNNMVTLDAAGMIALGVAVGQFVSAVYAASFAVADQLHNAPDMDTLRAIDPSRVSWPT